MALFLSQSAWASYRVYQIKVIRWGTTGAAGPQEMVLSTLDPVQYRQFHGGAKVLQTELVDTWYCPGDTSGKALCEKPKTAPTRGVASTDPKRVQ